MGSRLEKALEMIKSRKDGPAPKPVPAVTDGKLAKAVDWFTSEMRAKLLAKADQGYEGWDDPEYITGQWRDQTLGHVIRLMLDGDAGQAVDVANLAMFYAAFRKAQEDAK